jgi:5'-AMP-activated protein kinase regulatory gamma subunit
MSRFQQDLLSSSTPLSTISDIVSAIQNIFNSTKCYDVMQNSSKGTVFETTIPFQLAFFALVEHDTPVAPLWDPSKRLFVGMITVGDYIQSLRIWKSRNLPSSDLTTMSITQIMRICASFAGANSSPTLSSSSHGMSSSISPPHEPSINLMFKHAVGGFQSIDAEDSVSQMCLMLIRTGLDYLPVVDPDSGALVSILGYLDIVHLLYQASVQFPDLFALTIQQLNIGTFTDLLTFNKNTKICEVLDALEQRNISSAPVVDLETGRVTDSYHKNDVSFIIKAVDNDAVMANLGTYKIEEALQLREQLIGSGELMSSFEGLVKVKLSFQLNNVIGLMMNCRSTKVVVVDDEDHCLGILTIKDIIQHYI